MTLFQFPVPSALRSALPSVLRRAAMLGVTALAMQSVATVSANAQHRNSSNGGSGSSNARANTIPQVAKTAGQFTTLLAAVDAAGLTETLIGRGPFTVFAPTDDAFKKLPNGTVEELLKKENREKLVTILTYHVVAGRVTADQARSVRSAETVAGLNVRISESDGLLRINDATVRIADVPASNGIIHVIDRVLLPPEPTRSASNNSSNGGPNNAVAAVALVDYAIDRGAPLYNDGQPAATVAIYEVAINALLSLKVDDLPADTKRSLTNTLRDNRGGTSRERALALRRALDEVRRELGGRMERSR